MSINSRSQTTVEGLDELMKAFSKLGDDALPYITDASVESADIILARAKTSAAFSDRTGALRKSLKRSKPTKRSKYKHLIFSKVWFGKGGAHGVPVELGHKLVYFGHDTATTVKERPFLRPAADESKDEVIKEIAGAMNTALDRMGGLK